MYYTTNDGLSHNEVTSIIKDRTGFLWIGTRGGLNRFDGTEFKIFDTEIGNNNSLIGSSIESLYEDAQGQIWIGTKTNGISVYNPVNEKFTHFNSTKNSGNYIKGERIISITEGTLGEIWAGSWANGITIIDAKAGNSHQILPNTKISALLRAEDNTVWAVTAKGLVHFDLQGKQLGIHIPPTGAKDLNSITYHKESGLYYLGDWKSSLLVFNPKDETFNNISLNGEKGGNMNGYAIFSDNDEKIWIGSWGSGLKSYDPKTALIIAYELENHAQGGSKIYSDVISVYRDDLGILWLGTNGGGVCKVDNIFEQFDSGSDTNLPKEPVLSLMNDESNHLWLGIKTLRNLYYSKDGIKYTAIPVQDDERHKDGVRTIYQDLNKNIWAGTNRELFKVMKDKEGYKAFPVEFTDIEGGPLRIPRITALHQTANRVFWIGTQHEGLYRTIIGGNLSSTRIKHYSLTEKDGFQSDRITSFIEDHIGGFWIGTYNGLVKYNKEKDNFIWYYKAVDNEKSISSDIVICLFEDSKGRLWIGTPSGLNLKVQDADGNIGFQVFGKKDGLPSNYIHAILEDDSGNLWMSTNKGIAKFNFEDKIINTFDVNDGLKSNRFMENVAVKNKNGIFFWGGFYGLNIFHPDSIKRKILPKVLFTKLKINNKDIVPNKTYNGQIVLDKAIEYAKEVNLTYDQNTFSLFFTALNFKNKLQYTYHYKLEGAENEWHTGIDQKNITYSNLSPGNYTFNLKIINEEGHSSPESEASIHISIKPPFWATWQAYLLYVVGLIGIVWLTLYIMNQRNKLKTRLHLARMERAKEIELAKSKTNFFTNITHEFRTPLSLILGPVERLVEHNLDQEEQRSYLFTVRYHTKRLLRLVQQLLDLRKFEEGKLELKVAEGNFMKFAKEIFISFREGARAKDINFKFCSDADELLLTYDRDKMEIVICNLLINAFNYTEADASVKLSIKKISKSHEQESKEFCEIKVSDSGQGMSPDQLDRIFDRFYQVANIKSVYVVGSGIGLYLVKQIVDLHHGHIEVRSKKGFGSVFTITLPLGKSHFREHQFYKGFKKSEDFSHYDINEFPSYHLAEPKLETENNNGLISKKLLVVEDNPEIRKFICSIFRKDFKVLQADNGKKGLKLAKDELPDLIISDLMMPVIDGMALCKKLRDTKSTIHIPIIMLTARTEVVYEEQGYASGIDLFVKKPFHPDVLRAQVDALIAKRDQLKAFFGKMITLELNKSDVISEEEVFLNDVFKIVEDNLDNENLNRDFLAAKVAMSPSAFYRKIKSSTNLSTNAFIRSIRLKKAGHRC